MERAASRVVTKRTQGYISAIVFAVSLAPALPSFAQTVTLAADHAISRTVLISLADRNWR
jgi:hypothetical protein